MTQYLVIAGGKSFVREWDLPPGLFMEQRQLRIGAQMLQRNVLQYAVKADALPNYTAAEKRMMLALEHLFEQLVPNVAKKLAGGVMPTDEELTAAFTRVLQVNLSQSATEESLRLAAEVGVQFDPTVVHTAMAEWARTYSFGRVAGINLTTKKALQQIMELYASTPGMTRGEVEQAIIEDLSRAGAPFSASRAEAIAVTEITRGASAAHQEYQRELARGGLDFERVWRTREDEIVCPICGPLDKKPEKV